MFGKKKVLEQSIKEKRPTPPVCIPPRKRSISEEIQELLYRHNDEIDEYSLSVSPGIIKLDLVLKQKELDFIDKSFIDNLSKKSEGAND